MRVFPPLWICIQGENMPFKKKNYPLRKNFEINKIKDKNAFISYFIKDLYALYENHKNIEFQKNR